MTRISVTHFTDPGCPFAYSAAPALTTLQWRYGDQLDWRHVMIGLTEERRQYEERGYTPLRMALAQQHFRRYGMPFGRTPKPHVAATSRACRAVVAVREASPDLAFAMFRALQRTQFTTALPLDEDEALRHAAEQVPGVDADEVLALIDTPAVREAYDADRREARTAEAGPTDFQGKTANTDGAVRFTAPSLILEHDGRVLEAGGFQSLEVYDVLIANLAPTLVRRDAPEGAAELLDAFPYGLTTREVALTLAGTTDGADDAEAEAALAELATAGEVIAQPVGDGTLWLAAGSPYAERLREAELARAA